MIALVQIITSGSVKIFGKSETNRASGPGLSIFLGVDRDDSSGDIQKIVGKISKLRIFADENGKMNLDPITVRAQVLLISQFTLLGDCKGNNRPDFTHASGKEKAEAMINEIATLLENLGLTVTKGYFGEHMEISQKLDGPVTIIIDSHNL